MRKTVMMIVIMKSDSDSEKSKMQNNINSPTKTRCIINSMQKISSIHKFTLEIQLILDLRKLKGHTHFWSHPSKNHWRNFKLSWICISMQKKISLLCLFLFERDSAKFRNSWPEWQPDKTMPNQTFSTNF